MFHQLPKAITKPSYRNPDACEGTKERGGGGFDPWSFGKEIDLYNSRNLYTRGGTWRRPPVETVPWREEAGGDYVEFSSDLVSTTSNPRLCWAGWTRGWKDKTGTVRPEHLFVHRDDIFPRPQSRIGRGTYRTRRIGEAWAAWEKFGGVGARWSGDVLEVEFSSEPDEATLVSIGWKKCGSGELLDIDTPMPDWIRDSGFFLPGHDPLSWKGISHVAIKASWAEGCLPSSFTVCEPAAADETLRGCKSLPVGCEVSVDDRYSFGLFPGRVVPWIEGKIAVSARRMVPLITAASKLNLHLSRNGGAKFVFMPESIDFSAIKRPVVGTYFGKGGEERCLITSDAGKMKPAGVVSRTKIVENSDMFYRVIAPFGGDKLVSTQKMAGGARAGRLFARDRFERERLENLYGDVVEEDYYRRGEDYYREAARQRDEALRQGFCEISVARERSAVPGGVFDRLAGRGTVKFRKIVTGKKYFKPITFGDISARNDLVAELARIAREDDMTWLCQIVAMNPREFAKALVSDAMQGH